MTTIIARVSGYRSTVINALIDAVHSLRIVPGPGIIASRTPGGTTISLARAAAASAAPSRFSCRVDGDSLIVSEGSIRYHGIASVPVPESSISLSVSPAWISVAAPTASGTGVAQIVATSAEPASDHQTIYLPLCRVAVTDGGAWRITETCHVGDFHFYLPLR